MIFLCIFMLFSCFFHFTVLYNLHKTAILRFYAFLLDSLCYNESEGKPGLAVLDKALENSESAGAGLIDMISRSTMELSVNPYVGSNFDMTV